MGWARAALASATASHPPSKKKRRPGLTRRPGFARHRQSSSSFFSLFEAKSEIPGSSDIFETSRNSVLRPFSSVPKIRAGMTFVSFRTRTSPAWRSDGRSATTRWANAPVRRSSVMRRAVPRGAGRWAMDSDGSTKSKSATSIRRILHGRCARLTHAVEGRSRRGALCPSGASHRPGFSALSLAERVHALGARRVVRRARHAGDLLRSAAPRAGVRGCLGERRARLLEQGTRRDARRPAGVPSRAPVLGSALAFFDATGSVGDAALRCDGARSAARARPVPRGREVRGFSLARRECGIRSPFRDAALHIRPASLFARPRRGVPLRSVGRALPSGRSFPRVSPRCACGRAPRSRGPLGVPGGRAGGRARPLRGHPRAPARPRPRRGGCSVRGPSRRVRSGLLRGSLRAFFRPRALVELPVARLGGSLRHRPAVSGNPPSPARGPVERPPGLLAVSPPVARSASLVPRRVAFRGPRRARARSSLASPPLCGLPELARRVQRRAAVSRRGSAVPRLPVRIREGGIPRERARRCFDAGRLRDDARVPVRPSRVRVAVGLIRGVLLREGLDAAERVADRCALGGALRPAGNRGGRGVLILGREERRGSESRRGRVGIAFFLGAAACAFLGILLSKQVILSSPSLLLQRAYVADVYFEQRGTLDEEIARTGSRQPRLLARRERELSLPPPPWPFPPASR